MKPNFALNLSHEGISLLHRAKTGWMQIGDVSLDAPDLNAQLQMLRRTAANLDHGGLTTKLVIPNSQILYTEIEAPGPDTAARIAQIRDGLVGLTPYDVADLVFDWRMSGTAAQVAVVARETLHEAEAFAAEYRFNPVSFVALPVGGSFDGEPFFGPTAHAAKLLSDGETIEPDGKAMTVLRTGRAGPRSPAAAPEPDPAEDPAPEPAAPDPAPENPAPGAAAPEAAAEPAPAFESSREPMEEPAAPAPSEPAPSEPAPSEPAPSEPAEADQPAETPSSAAPEPAEETPKPATRPEPKPGAKPKRKARAKSRPKAEPKVAAPAGSEAGTGADEAADEKLPPMPVTFTSRRTILPAGTGAEDVPRRRMPPPPRAPLPPLATDRPEPELGRAKPRISPLKLDDVPDMPAWRRSDGSNVTHMPVTAAGTGGDDDRRRPRGETARAAGAALADRFGKIGQGTAASISRMRARKAAIEASANEADALTVFGARGQARVAGKPRYLGLALTLLLIAAMAVLALWSVYLPGDRGFAELPPPDPAPPAATVASVDPVATPVPTLPAAATPAAETPAAEAPDPAAESPAAGTTMPELAAPETSEDTAAAATGAPEAPANPIDAAVESALLAVPAPEAALPETAPPAPLSDNAAGAGTEGETPDPEAVADGEIETASLDDTVSAEAPPDRVTQPPPTPAEAEARYAATGIWQLDPAPMEGPADAVEALEDIYIASIDPHVASQDAVALPDARRLLGDQRPAALNPPQALGTRYDLDARGLVRATPEGALSPDGVRVFLGEPPVVPRLRPGSDASVTAAEPAPETLDPERERLRQIRPQARPETLQETNERSRLGGFSRTELAAIRPTVRPPSLQEEAAAEAAAAGADDEAAADEADIASFGDATDLAVTASLTPATRPADFSDTVEKALAEAARSAPATTENDPTPAVAAARVPSIPTRASVAKQATERNAINLGKINLIGVYGSPSDRRALVRLKSGRYIKVEVGDRVDGGRVAAIGDDELRYVKGGRNITLKLPKG